jgi:hypothetical protein
VGGSALAAPLSPEQEALVTVDITNGATYTIATIPPGTLVALSPDGTEVVAQYTCGQGCAAQGLPTEVIDMRTGAVHALPTSDKLIAGSSAFTWNPQDTAFAATLATGSSGPTPPQWHIALVDVQHDSATTLRASSFAIGWAPDGSTLLVGDAAILNNGGASGGDKVWFVTPGSGGSPVALPQPMVAFIGWVRTA